MSKLAGRYVEESRQPAPELEPELAPALEPELEPALERALAPASRISPDFNPLARLYRWLEYLSFGPLLWQCRIHFLGEVSRSLPAPAHVLVLGDGDGRFTARLLRDNPRVSVSAIDASSRMIASLERAAAVWRDRLSTEIADVRAWRPPAAAEYDLIVSHFFLDCLTSAEIAEMAARLAPSFAPDALWLVSEFAIPSGNYGRFVAAPLVALLYRVFGFVTGLRGQSLPDHAEALRAAGWSVRAQHLRLRGLLVSQLWCRGNLP